MGTVRAPEADHGPPPFLRLAAHPIRWRLLAELARSDRAVRELTALVGEPQNLVSYHLGHLRRGELVRARRSSADRRDAYYAIDLARCAELLQCSGAALHPGLAPAPAPPPSGTAGGRHGRRRRRTRVLFLCTGNGSRSQMAEALLRDRSGGAVEVVSAGTHPKPVPAGAIRAMADRGIDLGDARSKHVDVFARRRFDRVITLCDRVREACPDLAAGPDAVHWSIADPSLEDEAPGDGPGSFERVAQELETRIGFLLTDLDHRTGRTGQTHG
ncbi:MAG TPA: hypothetical protein VHK88_17555 [Aquihabitans sp.]|jgi:protein-tyrosine-phosphatase/DNA-binding transcriptional ArsR family regulator|nr:hypothetical protein [Aquihabitans sp.]